MKSDYERDDPLFICPENIAYEFVASVNNQNYKSKFHNLYDKYCKLGKNQHGYYLPEQIEHFSVREVKDLEGWLDILCE